MHKFPRGSYEPLKVDVHIYKEEKDSNESFMTYWLLALNSLCILSSSIKALIRVLNLKVPWPYGVRKLDTVLA